MRELWLIARKDLLLLVRDKMGLFFALVFPVIYAVFFGVIFSGGGGGERGRMAVVIVDNDRSPNSEQFKQALRDTGTVELSEANLATARDLVRRGERNAYVMIPEDYDELGARMFAGGDVGFEIGVDPSRSAEAGMLQGVIMQAAFEPIRKAGGGNAWKNPVSIQRAEVQVARAGPTNAFAVSFPQGIIWGIMGCAAGFGISLVVERRLGTLARLRQSPLSRAHILGGKALACFLTILTVAGGLLAIAAIFLGVRPTSIPLLVFGLVATGVGFVGIMMLLSVLGKTEQAAGGIGWAVLIVMAMLGGGMIPLFVMPRWMQGLGSISPVKWGILSMEGALWRGFDFVEMMKPCGILIAVGVVCFAIGCKVFSWSES